MKRTLLLAPAILGVIFLASPAFAVVPPPDDEAERLRDAPDLQERIDFSRSVLEPLLHPRADPAGVMAAFGQGIARHFELTSADESFIERYDKNADAVIDERDFIEMAFAGEILNREGARSPTHGESHCAVLLIKFPDQEPDPAHDPAFWQEMFFGESFWTTRSYYIQCSDNNLYLSGDVLTNPSEPDGWWMADYERSHYETEPLSTLLGEILDKADPYYDFSQYDADGNGESDGVYFIYAGGDTGWGSFYWGWAWYGPFVVDGVAVGPLMFCGEFLMTYRVAAHELGHMMGLPDLYDYHFIEEKAWGVGKWCLMGKGEGYMCPWSRMKLGWAEIINVSIDKHGQVLYPQVQNAPAYRLWTYGETSTDEYFLVNMIKRESYDVNLPGDGVMIWHIDENGDNNNVDHKLVDVEEADGLDDLDHFNNPGDETDPYYDPNNTTFDHDSYPNSDNYAGEETQVAVLNISGLGDTMTADLIVGVPGDLPVDETEPNDAWDDSGVIHIIPPNGVIDGSVDYIDDPSDFWRYIVVGPGMIKADLSAYSQYADLNLYLWGEDGAGPICSIETTNPGEHLECAVPDWGVYYLEIRAANNASYYDITASFTPFPDEGKIHAYGTDLLPPVVYANSHTIPALRVSLYNGGGISAQLNELRVYATGASHYCADSAKLWLDNGDVIFGPGLDELIAGPEPFDEYSQTVIFSGMSLDLDADTELFITIDLDELAEVPGIIGLRMFAYKDITVSDGLVEYHNFPLSSKLAYAVNPPMELCYVAAGDFTMGSDPGNDPYYDPACDLYDETPVHINTTGDYYITRYEVTNAQFAQFINQGGYIIFMYWTEDAWVWKNDNSIFFPNGWNEGEYPIGDAYPDYPVGGISYHEALAYTTWLGCRLPHEAEWEKAGRGTDARLFTYGNVYDASKYNSGTPPIIPMPVGSFPASDSLYGLADMHGNIFEWTDDGWESGLYMRYQSGDLKPPSGGSYRMMRGYGWSLQGWCGPEHVTRLSYRDVWTRTRRYPYMGFRVVFEPPY